MKPKPAPNHPWKRMIPDQLAPRKPDNKLPAYRFRMLPR